MLPEAMRAAEALKERKRQEMARALPNASELDDDGEMHGAEPHTYSLQIKRKRMNGILKKMMIDAGYDDLARMTSVRSERVDDELG